MIPVLFEIGPVKVYSYGVMMMAAFLTGYFLLRYDLGRRKLNPELAGDIIMWGAVGGILGSKLYYIIENIPTGAHVENLQALIDLLEGLFTLSGTKIAMAMRVLGSGLVFFGGLMGGTLAVTLYLRKKGHSWLLFADIVAPLLILGYAIGRIGCLLVGDDYGIASTLPWAMAFPKGIPPTLTPVHPTQIYETTLGIIIFGILWKLRTWNQPAGMLFFLYLILAGLERFFIEFIRTNPKYVFGLSGAQIISLVMIGIGTFLILRFKKTMNEESSAQHSSAPE